MYRNFQVSEELITHVDQSGKMPMMKKQINKDELQTNLHSVCWTLSLSILFSTGKIVLSPFLDFSVWLEIDASRAICEWTTQ